MSNIVSFKTKQDIGSSFETIFKDYTLKKNQIIEIADFVKNRDVANYFFEGNKVTRAYASNVFETEGAIKALNADFWSRAIKMTDVLSCMTAKKRNEWHEMIHDHNTPDFTPDTVVATIYDLLINRDNFLADKVDGIFHKLSPDHITNSPVGFSKRMIIDYLISSYGTLTDRVEYIEDLRSVMAKIMRREVSTRGLNSLLYDIIRNEQWGEWFSFDGGAFKIRLYKKGTAHLEIHEEMSYELNQILAQKYPMVIAAKSNKKTKTKKDKSFDLKMDLLSFETCNFLSDIADAVKKGNGFSVSYYDIKNKVTEQEIVKVLDYLQVNKSNPKYWTFNYDASMVLKEISRMGSIPEVKSHQFYPTEEYLSKKVCSLLDLEPMDQVLEPSAGLGGLALNLPKKRTTCVEISPIHCEALKGMGFKEVVQSDFLKYQPSVKFDKIAMNPPFTAGQAQTHLEHAVSLLKKEGKLVAILPASLKGKTFSKELTHNYSEVFTGEFSGANVSVVILELGQ